MLSRMSARRRTALSDVYTAYVKGGTPCTSRPLRDISGQQPRAASGQLDVLQRVLEAQHNLAHLLTAGDPT